MKTILQRSIDYIDQHLTEPITFHEVAQQAGFSPYHFHRVFHGITGFTITEYIRKRRLTVASFAILQGKEKIIDIALQCQFESQAAFTRAFQQQFGVTPGKYRLDRQPIQTFQKIHISNELDSSTLTTIHPSRFVEKDTFYIMGMQCSHLRYDGTSNGNKIPVMWEHLLEREHEIASPNKDITYGICAPQDETHFCYTAGAEVDENTPTISGMVIQKVPANTYAVFTHQGPTHKISETLMHIFKTWLPESGYEILQAPDFERYDQRFLGPLHEDSQIDLYFPVQPISIGKA